jgi:hypothetical protein
MSRPHVRRQGALVGLCGGSGLWSGWPRPDSCRECVAILDAEVAASMAAYAPSPAPPEAPSGGATSAVAGDLRPPMAEQVLALALADVRAVDTLLDAAGITAGPLAERVRHLVQARDHASATAADRLAEHTEAVRALRAAGVADVVDLAAGVRVLVGERDEARKDRDEALTELAAIDTALDRAGLPPGGAVDRVRRLAEARDSANRGCDAVRDEAAALRAALVALAGVLR